MMRTHSATAIATVLLISVGVVQCGGGAANPAAPTPSPSPGATPPAVSADLPTAAASAPGLYQDGLGTYPAGDDVYLSPDGRDLYVRPLCPESSRGTPRRLNLVLPPGAREIAAGRMSTCMDLGGNGRGEGIYLHLPNPFARQPGATVGASAPENADTSSSVFLFFNVDSNGDGTIRVPPDDQYNIRWQKGLYLHRRSDTATANTYTLTSFATEFGPDLSCDAQLILRNTPLGEVTKGTHCVPLVVTFMVQQ